MLSLIIIILIIAADRLTKHWAADVLQKAGSIPIIKGVLHLTYAENTGAAFSILKDFRWVFISVSTVVIAVLLYILYFRRPRRIFAVVTLSMLTGGAIGNMVDRVFFGYVVDMVDFRLVNFAIFNVADAFITTGAILFAALFLSKRDALEPASRRWGREPKFLGAFRHVNSLSKSHENEDCGNERD